MAVNKNFVVKNGLEVNTKLILADVTNQKVGIGSTAPKFELEVAGGIGATSINISGISTFGSDGSYPGTVTIIPVGTGNSMGVGTAIPAYLLDVRSSVATGTTALYVKGDGRLTGDFSVGDKLYVNGIELTGGGSIGTDIDTRNLNVSGIATIIGSVQLGTGLSVTGVSTFIGIIVLDFGSYIYLPGSLAIFSQGKSFPIALFKASQIGSLILCFSLRIFASVNFE